MLEGVTLKGRYRLDRRIDSGGTSAVFQATDLQTPRSIAVKVVGFAPGTRESAAAHTRFQDHAATAARLRHPNLVTVHEVGTDEPLGLDYVVMDLLQGEDLRQRMRRRNPLGWPRAARILHDAARGLYAGHRAALVHGRVRPASLFLECDADGKPLRTRVLDLGIDPCTGTGVAGAAHRDGTPSPASPYTAPEQRRGEAALTPAADVWALAVIAYELLTGTPPFTREQSAALARGTGVRPAAPSSLNATIPPAADALIVRSLSSRPEERPADGEAFARELEDIRRGGQPAQSPVQATVPEPKLPDPPPVHEDPSLAGELIPPPPPPRRSRGVRAMVLTTGTAAMVLTTGTAAMVAVFSIALAGRSLESMEEYIAGAQPVQPAREPAPGEIDHIVQVFNRIDDNPARTIREWEMGLGRLRRFEWRSADSAHATVYEDRNGIQKIRVRTYEGGEPTLSLLFYYDYGDKLAFVYEIRPSGGDGCAEQRFYFHDRALVLWRDTRNVVIPLRPSYDEFAFRFHRISDRLLELAHRARQEDRMPPSVPGRRRLPCR